MASNVFEIPKILSQLPTDDESESAQSPKKMSRHKLVKGLDLDDELADYDGAEDDTYEEEMTPEDKGRGTHGESAYLTGCLIYERHIEHLRRGVADVRDTLGSDFPVTDQEIEKSLYYYYYDVDKTVNYLLSMKFVPLPVSISLTRQDQRTKKDKPSKTKANANTQGPTSTGKSCISIVYFHPARAGIRSGRICR